MQTSFIGAENTWALLAITCGWAAFSIYAEQTWKWAARMSSVIVALLGALVLTNLGIIPAHCVFFDEVIWDYVVPISIPLLLLHCDVRKIGRESGRLLLLFLIGSVGTVLGAGLAFFLLREQVAEPVGVAAMLTGTYVGGTVNLVAMADAFSVSGETVSAAVVADNLLMTLYFFVLLLLPTLGFFQRHFAHAPREQKTGRDYWEKKPISLQDIAINLALSVGIVWVSTALAGRMAAVFPAGTGKGFFHDLLGGLLGNRYLILTTLTMLIATFFAKPIGNLGGGQELGTYFIHLFFFAVGAPASIGAILQNAPLLFLFCGIIVAANMLFCFGGGKLLGFTLEDCILASNACIGGPTTAAAMAISKGWLKLVAPIMLVGTLGYVLGSYLGTCVGHFLGV